MDKQLPSQRSTGWILRGTFTAAFSLSILLICYNVAVHSSLDGHHFTIPLIAGVYLVVAGHFYKARHFNTVNWMIIFFYGTLAFAILFEWGLNTPVGLFAMCFAVILPSILVSTKLVLPVAIMSIVALIAIQLIHTVGPSSLDPRITSSTATFWDVFVYSTILGTFALVSWVSGNQRHDLSSHLSVLNLDIDDLRQQHAHSHAIANVKDSIQHINTMVRQARSQLNSYGQRETFDARGIIDRSLKDMQEKFNRRKIVLARVLGTPSTYPISGSPAALMQIITILLNNSLDACATVANPKVTVSLKRNVKHIVVSVEDNGVGIPADEQQNLFTPVASTKPAGMGVGLYIAQHLTHNHFNGTLSLKPKRHGARFIITIPYA